MLFKISCLPFILHLNELCVTFSLMVSLLLSREYLHNIGLVDSGVAEMESIIEDFFGYDGRTAYVFTSDHGMTNWGNTVFVFVSFIL